MEGVSYHRYPEHPRREERRCHTPPRLPTPETSRSSNDAFDDESPRAGGRLPRSDRHNRSREYDAVASSFSAPIANARRDSRYFGAPHSPPYHVPDEMKPSLPPIQTVLAEHVSSPPKTPSPRASSMQPSPREPEFATSIYKPAAFYPNKKPRLDHLHTSSYASETRTSLPFAPSITLEPRPIEPSFSQSSAVYPPITQPPSRHDSRRPSIHSAFTSKGPPRPPWDTHHASDVSHAQTLSGRPRTEPYETRYQTPQLTPLSVSHEPHITRPSDSVQNSYHRDTREDFTYGSRHSDSRRSSVSGYSAYPPRSYDQVHSMHTPYVDAMRYSHHRDMERDPRDQVHYGRPESHHLRAANGFDVPSHQPGAPGFFMSAQFEYHHGKARKRSNLPKSSTEIMKNWFDQNIHNPYPSEEQKAQFAAATGISMTQVSNWFINHRRRCPELRDKRERTRPGSRECDL